MASEVTSRWKYTKRNIESIEDYCLHYKAQSKRFTYYTVLVGLILSLFNLVENEHLVWLVLITIIGINFFFFRRIKKLNQFQLLGIVVSKNSVVTSKYFRGDMLVPDKSLKQIPVIGQLFPKRFGKRLIVQPHYFVEVDNETFIVDSTTYEWIEAGQHVNLLYTPKYHLFLDIIPIGSSEIDSLEELD